MNKLIHLAQKVAEITGADVAAVLAWLEASYEDGIQLYAFTPAEVASVWEDMHAEVAA